MRIKTQVSSDPKETAQNNWVNGIVVYSVEHGRRNSTEVKKE